MKTILTLLTIVFFFNLSGQIEYVGFARHVDQGTYVYSDNSTFGFNSTDLGMVKGGNPQKMIFSPLNNDVLIGTLASNSVDNEFIYSYDVNTHEVKILSTLNKLGTGDTPLNGLVKYNDGKFYGIMNSGSTNGVGSLYKYDYTLNNTSVIHAFEGSLSGNADGKNPVQELFVSTDGRIYGSTSGGNTPSDNSTIFSYYPVSNTYTNFNSNGEFVVTTRFVEFGSNLYFGSGDKLFLFNKTTAQVSEVSFFGSATHPKKILQIDINGNDLLVLTEEQDPSEFTKTGFIYRRPFSTGVSQRVHAFDDLFPTMPPTSIESADFKIGPDKKIICIFTAGTNSTMVTFDEYVSGVLDLKYFRTFGGNFELGSESQGGIYHHTNGKVYIPFKEGGLENKGTVSEYNKANKEIEVAFHYDYHKQGKFAITEPLQIGYSDFVGATFTSGPFNHGCIFNYNYKTYKTETLFALNDSTGYPVNSDLIKHKDKIYGVTNNAAEFGQGNLFSLDPLTKDFQILHPFNDPNGRKTNWQIHMNDSVIYGTLADSQADSTWIYSFNLKTNLYQLITQVPIESGKNINRTYLTPDSIIYLVSTKNGDNDLGQLTQYDPLNNVFTTIVNFSDTFNAISSINYLNNGKVLVQGNDNSGPLASPQYYYYEPLLNTFTKFFERTPEEGSRPIGVCGHDPSAGILFIVNLDSDISGTDYGSISFFKEDLSYYEETESLKTYNLFASSGVIYIDYLIKDPINGVGLEEYEMEPAEFILYPNPAFTTFGIQSESKVKTVLITDVNGRVISLNKNNQYSNEDVFDISFLDKGVYFVSVRFEDNQVSVKKLIVK
ncbi:MAG: hypothetical protein ACI9XP_001338 [Lentimonas sp.]|jgi:hypothetical protein